MFETVLRVFQHAAGSETSWVFAPYEKRKTRLDKMSYI